MGGDALVVLRCEFVAGVGSFWVSGNILVESTKKYERTRTFKTNKLRVRHREIPVAQPLS